MGGWHAWGPRGSTGARLGSRFSGGLPRSNACKEPVSPLQGLVAPGSEPVGGPGVVSAEATSQQAGDIAEGVSVWGWPLGCSKLGAGNPG